MDQHLENNKQLFKDAVNKYLESGTDDDYEKCQYAKRQLCKCQQMITNIKNKRLEQLKQELSEDIITEVFIKEVVQEPIAVVVEEPIKEVVEEVIQEVVEEVVEQL